MLKVYLQMNKRKVTNHLIQKWRCRYADIFNNIFYKYNDCWCKIPL